MVPAIGFKNYQLTSEVALYASSNSIKLNYSPTRIAPKEVWVKPVDLLFESAIKEQDVICFDYNNAKAFFKTNLDDIPFDVFAASFYLLSRYEEYLPHKLDVYGRYGHENSVAYKEGFLNLPLVNLWLQKLSELLKEKIPSLLLTPPTFQFLPTYDIDIAYSYLYKGWFRNAGGFIRSMWNSDWRGVQERLQVLFGNQKDPFDSYDWLHDLHSENHLKPLYFFLLASKNKSYDKNILPSQPAFQKLIRETAAKYGVGIHPSWQSGDKPGLRQLETESLQKLTGERIFKSRQHYIRMTLPETYRSLIAAGITEDFSMGYGSVNGFRASYCLPYKWYDLQKEQSTDLTIFPFCYMDANSYYEQHYAPEQALQEMKHYYKITKQVSGLLITIWHNHFLGTDRMFTGWREVYKTWVEQISND